MSHPSFERSLEISAAFVAGHRDVLGDAVLVRDLRGILRLAIDDRDRALDSASTAALAEDLDTRLGAWSPGASGLFLRASQLFDAGAVFSSPETVRVSAQGVRLLDRLVTGADWLRQPDPPTLDHPHPPRAVFFGVKGGVGRSTALAVAARELAALGRRVLVVDLDLESPGVSHLLLGLDRFPGVGLLDAYVELGVYPELPRETLLGLAGRSALDAELEGEILVVPPRGQEPGDYLGKLSRAYAEGHGARGSFAARTRAILEALEADLRPDVVLVDSRAGLHDVAATAITRLDAASCLLFAGASDQTWQDYRLLFEAWNQRGRAAAYRDRLKVVAALVPEVGGAEHRERVTTAAHRLFAETLYDEEAEEDLLDLNAFNFDRADEDAPHFPVPVAWQREFFEWDSRPGRWPDPAKVELSFGPLIRALRRLVLEEP